MIRFEQVSKSFSLPDARKVIVEDLTLELPRRNIAIIGINGAGKSTLLQLIAGTMRPDKGTIHRSGRISWPLGFQGSFAGALSGAENVRFVARIYGQDTEHVIEQVAEFAELGPFFAMPVRSYSSGMRARLAFGLSLAVSFDCYLVDEITAVGDELFRRKAMSVFRERLSRSRIIMVSHSRQTLKDYCDMGLVLHDGRATLFDNLNDAFDAHSRNMSR
jgi:capsular polysaccharide transport system ATP-binding protein